MIHVASVVVLDSHDPDEVINPAVQGTVGILESARLHGSDWVFHSNSLKNPRSADIDV